MPCVTGPGPRDRLVHACGVGDDQGLAVRSVALVEDDDRLGTSLLGVERLRPEEAGPTLDECDVIVTAEIEAGEVRCLASARGRPVTDEVDVDWYDVALDLPSRCR